MEAKDTKHWTEENHKKFQAAISLDFIDQIETKMDVKGIKQSELAQALEVTEGRISQIMNNPGNLTLKMMVKCARAVGLKLTVMAYDDGDPENTHGPIHAEVFRHCWELVGKPKDMWPSTFANLTTLPDFFSITKTATSAGGKLLLSYGDGGSFQIDRHSSYATTAQR